MQVWEAQRARAEAMLRLDDGDVPGARAAMGTLIDALAGAEGQLRYELAFAYVDRSTASRFANDWPGALNDLDTAAALAAQLPLMGRRPILVNVHNLRAKIRSTRVSSVFDLAKAQSDVDQLAALMPDHWMVAELQSHVAFQKQDWNVAASKALEAAARIEPEGWARGVAACRRRAGEALLELGRVDDAELQLLTASGFFEQHGPPELLSETRLARARVASRQQRHDEAWTLVGQSLDEVESRVRRFVDVAEQQRFVIDKLRFYDHAFDIGLACGAGKGWLRAWSVAERSKSFYLAHLLANADVPLFDGVDPNVIAEVDRLEAELDACERKLGTRSGGADEDLEARLRKLSDVRSELLQSIMKTNPRWASLRHPPPFDPTALVDRLPEDVTPVSFYWRDAAPGARLHVFGISAGRKPIHADVAWDAAQLSDLALRTGRLRGAVDDYVELFAEGTTDRVLPPEFRAQLPAEACLLISAHGRLRGIPLHALPLDDATLIERWAVQYVPSLGLPHAAPRAPGTSVLLMGSAENAFGDPPLGDVESELTELQEVWRSSTREVVSALIDRDATPVNAGWPPSKWGQFGVLHFACHGRFVEGRPLDGALRLGRDAVRGSELFATKLTADVVALSACALGQRAERFGDTQVVSEEWVGLYLPLFYAGARALVVSLWDANSRVTRQFMVAFHQKVAQGEAPHAAFRSAVRDVAHKLPARWANWCLVGLPGEAN